MANTDEPTTGEPPAPRSIIASVNSWRSSSPYGAACYKTCCMVFTQLSCYWGFTGTLRRARMSCGTAMPFAWAYFMRRASSSCPLKTRLARSI